MLIIYIEVRIQQIHPFYYYLIYSSFHSQQIDIIIEYHLVSMCVGRHRHRRNLMTNTKSIDQNCRIHWTIDCNQLFHSHSLSLFMAMLYSIVNCCNVFTVCCAMMCCAVLCCDFVIRIVAPLYMYDAIHNESLIS